MRHVLIGRTFGLCVLCCAWVSQAADTPTSPANAAGIIIGAISGREALISQCRELEPEHASEFDGLYTSYFNSAFHIKLRAREVLLTEGKRAGRDEQQLRELVSTIAETVTAEITQAFRTNSGMFKKRCSDLRAIPLNLIDAMVDLRQYYPKAVSIVEDWN